MVDAFVKDVFQTGFSVGGVDPKRVFAAQYLVNSRVIIPPVAHILSDFRPISATAQDQARLGVAPETSKVPKFDPLFGPFSEHASIYCGWAQGLEFMRDIKSLELGGVKLAPNWVEQWLKTAKAARHQANGLFAQAHHNSTKAQRLLWRARRVQNCLAHIVPLLPKLKPGFEQDFWQTLIDDIGKLGAPTDSLWAQLMNGFDPLSARAIWYRSITLLAVETALPGFLQRELLVKARDQIAASVQSDGMFLGGSVIATLSAGADLCMLTRNLELDSVTSKVRGALASLCLSDGGLVSFGEVVSCHRELLAAVLGPDRPVVTSIMPKSGIVSAGLNKTKVWLKAPTDGRTFGAALEIEADGHSLFTNGPGQHSAIRLNAAASVSTTHCKRRDEENQLILQTSAEIIVHNHPYTHMRQIRISNGGRIIEGEDILRGSSPASPIIVTAIWFVLPQTCHVTMSRDGQSALIVTSQQHAWRFRAQGMDISVEIGSETFVEPSFKVGSRIITCRLPEPKSNCNLSVKWRIASEETE